jgi:hypothetical protein
MRYNNKRVIDIIKKLRIVIYLTEDDKKKIWIKIINKIRGLVP